MCTSLAFLAAKDFYFGRNMDIDKSMGEQVTITPRNFPLPFREEQTISRHYAFVGMACVRDGYPLYSEAVNEKGVGITCLAFSGNAVYADKLNPNKHNISTFELIHWLMGQCANITQVRALLAKTNVTSAAFSEELPPAETHWHIADEQESVVLEIMADGMHIYDNPTGVATNNPPFPYHLANLNYYLNLTPKFPQNQFAEELGLKPLGVGYGSVGLPGDASAISRFIRLNFLKANSPRPETESQAVNQFFHLLDGVSLIRGAQRGYHDEICQTTFNCCVNASRGIFYYKTYDNHQITAVDMHRENLDGSGLIRYDLIQEEQFRWEQEEYQ